MKLLLIFLIFLSGCDQETVSMRDKSDYDLIDGNTGLKVKFDVSDRLPIYIFTGAWSEVQICTGLSAYYGPYIAVVDYEHMPENGKFYHSDKVIEVKISVLMINDTLKHEMIHFLLLENGLDDLSNQAHNSDLFNKCAPFM